MADSNVRDSRRAIQRSSRPTTSDIVQPTPTRSGRCDSGWPWTARAARRRRCGSGNRHLGAVAGRTRGSRHRRRTGGRHAGGQPPPTGTLRGWPDEPKPRGCVSQAVDLVLCGPNRFIGFEPRTRCLNLLASSRRDGVLPSAGTAAARATRSPAGYRQAIVDVGGEMTAESRPFDPDVISDSGLFSSPERKSFPNFQRLDLAGLIGRARSASYVPKSGAAGERLLSLLRALHERYADGAGFVTLIYDTEVFCSTKL